MAIVDNRGLVNNGDPSLTVQNNLTAGGMMTVNQYSMSANALQGSSSLVIAGYPGPVTNVPASGFYQVPVTGAGGMGYFTGNLPNAALQPGGIILITDTKGQFPYLLTGALAVNVGNSSTTWIMSSSLGTRLSVTPGGTVGLWSDTKGWLLFAVSGSATMLP